MNKHNLKAGDALFVVFSDTWRNSEIVKISKVGRKWLHLAVYGADYKADIETLRLDGGNYSSPGQCYLSEIDYINHQNRLKVWSEISQLVSRRRMPEGMTLERMREILEELSFD